MWERASPKTINMEQWVMVCEAGAAKYHRSVQPLVLFCSQYNTCPSHLAATSNCPHGLGLFSNDFNLPVGNHFSQFCCEWRLQSGIGGQVRCSVITRVLTSALFLAFILFSLFGDKPPIFFWESTFAAVNYCISFSSGFVSRMTKKVFFFLVGF